MGSQRRGAGGMHLVGRLWRRFGLGVGLALLAWAALGPAPVAGAEAGVTIGIGRIIMHEPLRARAEHALPGLPVTNSGTAPGVYRVVVTTLGGQAEQAPDPAWFTFDPARFELAPGERREVAVRLRLPWLLAPGAYAGLVQIGPVLDAGEGGTGLAVAAAAHVTFTVAHGDVVSGALYDVATTLQQRAPWSYMLLGAACGVIGSPVLNRLLTLGGRRRR